MLRYMFQYKFSILLVIVIAMLSLVPGSSMPYPSLFSIPYIDKIVHFSMYAPLGFVALMESRRTRPCSAYHLFISAYHLFIIVILFLLSGLIEILQATVVATRAAEWTDLLANLLGLLAGYLTYRLVGGFRLFRFFKS